MLDIQRVIGVRPLPGWATPLLGALAGLLAVGLLSTLSPLLALAGICAIVAGFLTLTHPHLALYVAVGSMIVFWPGPLIKAVDLAIGSAALLWALATRRRLVPRDGVLLILTLLVGLIWLSALRVGNADAVKRALGYTSYLALYWTISTLTISATVVRRMVGAMLLSGVIIAIIGIVQIKYPFIGIVSFVNRFAEYSESGDLVDAQLWDGVFRVESLTGGPNLLGLSMQILLPFSFFWTIRQTSALWRVAGAAAIALMSVAMVLSLTRGVLLTTPLIVVPFLIARFGWRRSLPYAGAALIVLGGAAVAWEPLRSRIVSNLSEWLGGDTTLSGTWRLESFPIGVRMLQDYFWLGAGIEQQVTLWEKYAPSDLIVLREMVLHNDYLLIGIELGVAGFTLLLALLSLTWLRLRRLHQHFRATDQRGMLDYAWAAEASWVAMAANLMIYPLMHNFRYFWVLLALIGALSRVRQDQIDDARQSALAVRRSPRGR